MRSEPVLAAGFLALLVGATVASATWVRRADQAAAARRRTTGALAPSPVPGWFARLVSLAGSDVAPEGAWPVARASAGLGWIALAFASPVGAVAVAGAAVAVLVADLLLSPVVRRRRAAGGYDADLLAAVEVLATELRSGSPLAAALGSAAPPTAAVGRDLAEVVERHRRGERLDDGLDAWGRARADTAAGLVADAIALAGTSGGSRARALAGVAETLRERVALAREIRALSAQARASVVVLVVTPVAFAAAVSVLDHRVCAFLVATPPGWACLGFGTALDAAGALWMARLLRGLG